MVGLCRNSLQESRLGLQSFREEDVVDLCKHSQHPYLGQGKLCWFPDPVPGKGVQFVWSELLGSLDFAMFMSIIHIHSGIHLLPT